MVDLETPLEIHLHPWGFIGQNRLQHENDSKFKTLRETLTVLGHEATYIDLLVLDCEGCEFDLYEDIVEIGKSGDDALLNSTQSSLPTIFLQLMVQVHGFATPKDQTNSFFSELTNEGEYAIFHKSAEVGSGGNVQNYGFIKLRKDFF